MLDARGRRELSAELYDRIASADPYDDRWLRDWIGYVDYRESIDWGDVSYADTADWLATLVPRTRTTALAIAHMTQDLGRWDEAMAFVDASLARRFDDAFAAEKVALIEREDRIGGEHEQIALLERTLEVFPHRGDLSLQLAGNHRFIGNLDEALRAEPARHRSSSGRSARLPTARFD